MTPEIGQIVRGRNAALTGDGAEVVGVLASRSPYHAWVNDGLAENGCHLADLQVVPDDELTPEQRALFERVRQEYEDGRILGSERSP